MRPSSVVQPHHAVSEASRTAPDASPWVPLADLARHQDRAVTRHGLSCRTDEVVAVPAAAVPRFSRHREVAQPEFNDEARSDRYRKRGHFGGDRCDGAGECTALSPIRPCANLCPAGLSTPKPPLGSPRRSAHGSVCRPEQCSCCPNFLRAARGKR
jgi:hypothetical protein